mgnify:CR=1 FL=1
MDFEKDLRAVETNIPGLVVFDLPVHGDNRGWFKENWQRAKQTNLGPGLISGRCRTTSATTRRRA